MGASNTNAAVRITPPTTWGYQMLRKIAVIGLALGLLACSSTLTPQQEIAQAASDVALITSGLKAALPLVASATKIDPATEAKVSAALGDLASLSNQLAAAATQSQAQDIVTQVETDVNSVVTSLGSVQGLPPNVSQILQAAAVLLPTVETVLNMSVLPAPVVPTPAPAVAPPLTPQQAIQVLVNATVR
jgi:hypothetical protein